MRRKDRQITDSKHMEAILQKADCVRLGLVENGLAYIVPMSFGICEENGKLCLYFHSAQQGRKIDLIGQSHIATFEADTGYELIPDEKACEFTCYYQSVMGRGTISILHSDEEKLRALQCLMEHYTNKTDWRMPENMLHGVVCIKLEIEEMTGKAHTES